MHWYQWLALIALLICLISCFYHLVRLIRLGSPNDFALPKAKPGPSIKYSFTGAMSPGKKESAYLHVPTYTAGIVYHIGTFIAILIFLIQLTGFEIIGILSIVAGIYILVSFLCGIGILVKRIIKKELLHLSNVDDYISNLLVTFFQLFTSLLLFNACFNIPYYIITSVLLLYIPVGKLKHMIYFFAARYHLGLFYGRRGVWPSK